ncbi:TetR family transcriptional regulator [Oxalicibacterium solurbis]|uniref:Uncharacterized protein n=1 Tax=Oxalicibacterium solurbis TaxID=69280 RepID=A0A8J3AUM4_9BURK|nr:TetR family transcriptional regulator [Oxalicibacterium solurbis]GGI53227.1 hypothetical protein GCM10011430_04010 [Oxalicibacterium solurbis]
MRNKKIIQPALQEFKQKSREVTRLKLENALQRLSTGNPLIVESKRKISVSLLAEEAQVDRVTIYRFHKTILTELTRLKNEQSGKLLESTNSSLKENSLKIKEYMQLAANAQEEVIALARQNYLLSTQISALQETSSRQEKLISDLKKQITQESEKLYLVKSQNKKS